MRSKIAQLLLKLQEDMNALKEFKNDPDKVLTEAGIVNDEARDAFRNGDIIGIRKLLFEIERGSQEY